MHKLLAAVFSVARRRQPFVAGSSMADALTTK
jgi:hypothetical protein